MVQPAFAEITKAIGSIKGISLERATIDGILRSAALPAVVRVPDQSIMSWVPDPTQESFEPNADDTLVFQF